VWGVFAEWYLFATAMNEMIWRVFVAAASKAVLVYSFLLLCPILFTQEGRK
jgi:hypothetical protein